MKQAALTKRRVPLRVLPAPDLPFLVLVLTLVGFGLVMLGSASGAVALYRRGGQWQGIACTQDKPNPLTAQVSQPGELLRYVTDLLPNQLDGMGETG